MMRAAILFLATAVILLAASKARGVEVDAQGRIVLSPEERAHCIASGGCVVTTERYIDALERAAEKLERCEKLSPPPKRAPRKNET